MLTITSIPFRSSRLAVPPSPFSPLLPITPSTPPRHYSPIPNAEMVEYLPPPTRKPMAWAWVCHVCHRSYNLGVTRRCLDDGHYFCAGTTTIRSRRDGVRRTRRHRACGSEFDYNGWKEWGVWRRNLLALSAQRTSASPCDSMFESDSEDDMVDVTETVVSPITPNTKPNSARWRRPQAVPTKPAKDCWNSCDYPSDCRWGKSHGVATPAQPSFPIISMPSIPNLNSLTDVEMEDEDQQEQSLPRTQFSDILNAEQQSAAEVLDGVDDSATPSPALQELASLVTRAQRRHSRSDTPSSPLAHEESTTTTTTCDMQTEGDMGLRRTSSRETLRRTVEGFDNGVKRGINALASMVGSWRSSSAPPAARHTENDGFEDVPLDSESSGEDGRSSRHERRRSFG